MHKHTINKLKILNKSKQDQLQIESSKLQLQIAQLSDKINEKQRKVEELHYAKNEFRNVTYKQSLTNQIVKSKRINQLQFNLKQFEVKIEEIITEQNELNQQVNNISQELEKVKNKLRQHMIKDKKYDHIKTNF